MCVCFFSHFACRCRCVCWRTGAACLTTTDIHTYCSTCSFADVLVSLRRCRGRACPMPSASGGVGGREPRASLLPSCGGEGRRCAGGTRCRETPRAYARGTGELFSC